MGSLVGVAVRPPLLSPVTNYWSDVRLVDELLEDVAGGNCPNDSNNNVDRGTWHPSCRGGGHGSTTAGLNGKLSDGRPWETRVLVPSYLYASDLPPPSPNRGRILT